MLAQGIVWCRKRKSETSAFRARDRRVCQVLSDQALAAGAGECRVLRLANLNECLSLRLCLPQKTYSARWGGASLPSCSAVW